MPHPETCFPVSAVLEPLTSTTASLRILKALSVPRQVYSSNLEDDDHEGQRNEAEDDVMKMTEITKECIKKHRSVKCKKHPKGRLAFISFSGAHQFNLAFNSPLVAMPRNNPQHPQQLLWCPVLLLWCPLQSSNNNFYFPHIAMNSLLPIYSLILRSSDTIEHFSEFPLATGQAL